MPKLFTNLFCPQPRVFANDFLNAPSKAAFLRLLFRKFRQHDIGVSESTPLFAGLVYCCWIASQNRRQRFVIVSLSGEIAIALPLDNHSRTTRSYSWRLSGVSHCPHVDPFTVQLDERAMTSALLLLTTV